jgi:tetratricopeptide (TPR) repeat protein
MKFPGIGYIVVKYRRFSLGRVLTMKRKGFGIALAIGVILLLLAFAGCASLSVAFSRGGSALNDAKKALSEGRGLDALLLAADSLKLDPKLVQAQEFLRDNFRKVQSDALDELAKSANSSDTAVLARRVRSYHLFVKIHTALATLSLPFRDAAGKWEWTTEIRDFSTPLKAEKAKAYAAFFARGVEEIGHGRIQEAKAAFESAIVEYADESAGEASRARSGAASACLAFTEPFAQSYDVGELKNAIDACMLALHFEPSNPRASEVLKRFSSRLADQYVSQGMTEEHRGQTENLKKAAKLYEEALVWNPAQGEALMLLARVKATIASRYYGIGVGLEERKVDPDPEGAIQAYREARRWVPEYLDTTRRIYMISINGELRDMLPSVSGAEAEMARLYDRITAVSYKVDTSISRLDRIQAIVSNIGALEPRASEVLKKLAELSEGIYLQKAVADLAAGFSPILASAIRIGTAGGTAGGGNAAGGSATAGGADTASFASLKAAFSDLKTVTDRTKGSIEGMRRDLGRLVSLRDSIAPCISTLKAEDDFQKSLDYVKALSRETDADWKGLRSFNVALDGAEAILDDLSRSAMVQSAADSLLSGIDQRIVDLGVTSRDLEAALERRVTVDAEGSALSYSVREILKGLPREADAYRRQFLDASESATSTIPRRLGIQLPRTAPFDDFAADMKKLPTRFSVAASSSKTAQDASLIVAQSGKKIQEILRNLSTLTACRPLL